MKRLFIIFTFIFLLNFSYAASNKPTVNATNAIAIDTVTGRILYEKNAFSKKPMASTTKVMTAIIAIENNSLDDIVTISKKAAGTGGSSAHLKAGKEIKLSELLYGLMLNSGNDAAVAIAEHTAGSVEEFAKLMNAKAIELGAFDTNFVTPHGLDVNNHYSTAYDMALITSYALKNPTFAKIVSTTEKYMTFTDGTGVSLNNTNKLLVSYPGATGVKTGYTGMAGRCLIGSAKRNNWEVITVVFGEPDSTSRINDTTKILNYCFDNYSFIDLRDLYKINFSVKVLKSLQKEIIPKYEYKFIVPVTDAEKGAITVRKNIVSEVTAPITTGLYLGEIEFLLNDTVLGTIPLICDKDIERQSILDYYKNIFDSFINLEAFN